MTDLNQLIAKIKKAKSVLLSTHRQCDGDGLGAQLGLFHALNSIGIKARVLNVDKTPKKYDFLSPSNYIQCYEEPHSPIEKVDLALIMDTNDHRLIEPLYPELEKYAKEIIFIDHHPVLKTGPLPTSGSYINANAASTGEIAFNIIKKLGVKMNKSIARAIYTSIVFDTQLFRYVRNSPNSHIMAAELLEFETNPAEVHQCLFGNHTVEKIKFLSSALEKIEYYCDGKIAVLNLSLADLEEHSMDPDESRDLIDMIMNIDTLIAGVMIREEADNQYKVSLRSKGQIEVRGVAESLNGGGHLFAAGATVFMAQDQLKNTIVNELDKLINTQLNESSK